ncbi:MAG: 30S ribosomal protein S9 [Dehalococcoidia bacterium]|nr:30S ribosomal protein S9 [Dehalococcoidia bacterium]
MADQIYYSAVGRRKCAIARVRLIAGGNGSVIINGKPYTEVFSQSVYRSMITRPLALTETADKYNVSVKVLGGGVTGWSGAISLGIARALVKLNEGFKSLLRSENLLTRDARVKERKKPGLKRARKAPQYTKR